MGPVCCCWHHFCEQTGQRKSFFRTCLLVTPEFFNLFLQQNLAFCLRLFCTINTVDVLDCFLAIYVLQLELYPDKASELTCRIASLRGRGHNICWIRELMFLSWQRFVGTQLLALQWIWAFFFLLVRYKPRYCSLLEVCTETRGSRNIQNVSNWKFVIDDKCYKPHACTCFSRMF